MKYKRTSPTFSGAINVCYIVMSEMFSKYIYILFFFHLQLIQRNKNNWPLEQKYVPQDLHRKQVHVSSVPCHCVHQYFNSNWRWDRNSV